MVTKRPRRIRLLVLVLTAVVLHGLHTRAVAQQSVDAVTDGHPLWEADLKQFGYVAFPRKQMRPLRPSAEFTDSEHLAVGWVTPDTNQQANFPRWGEPAHLHVVLLDASSGRKKYDKEWVTSYTATVPLYGLGDGRLVICAGNSLQLLSPTLDVLREQELPNKARCSQFSFQASPSRQTLLLSYFSEHSRELQLVHSDTLQTLTRWTEAIREASSGQTVSVSDRLLAGYCGDPHQICLRPLDGKWHPFDLSGLNTRMADHVRIPTSFLNDKVLMIGANPAAVANIEGTKLFNIKLPRRHYVLLPTSAKGGNRFAVVEARLRGIRSEPLDMYPFQSDDRALVYGVTSGKQEFSLKLQGTSPWSPWRIHDTFLALSPDGTCLAVISDGVLRAYRIP